MIPANADCIIVSAACPLSVAHRLDHLIAARQLANGLRPRVTRSQLVREAIDLLFQASAPAAAAGQRPQACE
jgi:hypothetical protein